MDALVLGRWIVRARETSADVAPPPHRGALIDELLERLACAPEPHGLVEMIVRPTIGWLVDLSIPSIRPLDAVPPATDAQIEVDEPDLIRLLGGGRRLADMFINSGRVRVYGDVSTGRRVAAALAADDAAITKPPRPSRR
jgi:hypothetical protein